MCYYDFSHDVYEDGDINIPQEILNEINQVEILMCKNCKQVGNLLELPCPQAQIVSNGGW